MSRPTRVAFVSLGCVKNLVDTEKMLGLLAEAGCHVTADEADADVVVVNTCGFLAAARDEAVGAIKEVLALKRSGRVRRVVVAGCLVQRDGEALLESAPGIDALVGVNNRGDIVRAVLGGRERAKKPSQNGADGQAAYVGPGGQAASGTPRTTVNTAHRAVAHPPNKGGRRPACRRASSRPVDWYLADYYPRADDDTARLRITPRHYAYLRVSEGCDQKCTFCTIPAIRGPMHCKPPEAVLAEARELVADGAVEINLIGQDTTSYGADLPAGEAGPGHESGLGGRGYEPGLAGLLRLLDAEVDGLRWLRLMYAYPSVMTDRIIDALAECSRVVKYVDLPLQHVNDRMLKRMHRGIDRKTTESLLQKLRDRIPGVTIRTTMMVGFPGETDEEFEELARFVRGFRFEALGAFAFSPEPDTPAGRMTGQVPEQVKQQRLDALMTAQQEVAFALADRRKGERFEVLVEGPPANDGLIPARHAGQAPEVDSVTWLQLDEAAPAGTGSVPTAPGSFVTVCCTGRRDYDLLARPVLFPMPVVE